LGRAEIVRAWGGGSPAGEKAVANYDEDSVTMAVGAAINCLGGIERSTVDALYLASTTLPYTEKQSASTAAIALDLRRDTFTADLTDSIRSGTIAMRTAADAIGSGSVSRALVMAADCRLGLPGSKFEKNFGDGAAAFLMGDSDIAVSIEGSITHSDEFLDHWQMKGNGFIQSWEERFVVTSGYQRNMKEAISRLMQKYNLKPQDFSKAAIYAPDARSQAAVLQSLGFDPKTQVPDSLFDNVGNTGCAFAPMILVAALEEAKPGDRILFAGYGDGCDAYVLCVTEENERIKAGKRKGVKSQLASGASIGSYEKYERFRRVVADEPEGQGVAGLLPQRWRDISQILGLHGSKCRNCGTTQFPIQVVCAVCQSKGNYDEIRLSDKKGKIFTYSKDFLSPSLDPPLVRCVVDFEDGGRMLSYMTDCEHEKVAIDLPVDLTFRKLVDVQSTSIRSYFWKFVPAE